jgi:hypothetical protein
MIYYYIPTKPRTEALPLLLKLQVNYRELSEKHYSVSPRRRKLHEQSKTVALEPNHFFIVDLNEWGLVLFLIALQDTEGYALIDKNFKLFSKKDYDRALP